MYDQVLTYLLYICTLYLVTYFFLLYGSLSSSDSPKSPILPKKENLNITLIFAFFVLLIQLWFFAPIAECAGEVFSSGTSAPPTVGSGPLYIPSPAISRSDLFGCAGHDDPDLDLSLRLGPPGAQPRLLTQQGIMAQLAPGPSDAPFPPQDNFFSKINNRLLFAAGKKVGWETPAEKIGELIALKSQIIDRMGELDPHPFWQGEENRTRLIGDSILTKNGWEYKNDTLTQKLRQLNEKGKKSTFFKELCRLREDGGGME